MNSKQRPNSLADLAATRRFLLTSLSVLKIVLHLGTIGRIARRRCASRRVLDQLYVQLQVALPFAPLGFCQATGVSFLATLIILVLDGYFLQFVRTSPTICFRVSVAILAEIVIRARITVEAITSEDFTAASGALLNKLGGVSIV